MDAYEKLKKSLYIKPPKSWSEFNPSDFPAIAHLQEKMPDRRVFNLWLWQTGFKHPKDCPSVTDGSATVVWLVAEEFSLLEHKGMDVGMAAYLYSVEEFAKYIKGFNGRVTFMNSSYRLKKYAATEISQLAE
jgi:hypothetical protein